MAGGVGTDAPATSNASVAVTGTVGGGGTGPEAATGSGGGTSTRCVSASCRYAGGVNASTPCAASGVARASSRVHGGDPSSACFAASTPHAASRACCQGWLCG